MKKQKLAKKILHFRNNHKRKWYFYVPSVFFWVQFLFSAYLTVQEVLASCTILQSFCNIRDDDIVTFHYFKLMVLLPIFILSFSLVLLDRSTRWNFDFEKEVIEAILALGWVVFAVVHLLMRVYILN